MQLLSSLTNTVAAAGDTTLIAAPGTGLRVVVSEVSLQNEGAADVTVLVKNGATTIRRFLLKVGATPTIIVLCADKEWRLSANLAFVLNLSAAVAVGYNVAYNTEAIIR